MDISKLNNFNHTFVIAEAGSNWKVGSYDEDLSQAKKLIDLASQSGADAVKFQTYRPDTVYAIDAGKSTHLSKRGLDDDIHSIFKRHSMPYEMIPILANYCKNKKIQFMSTPFSIQDAKEIDPFVEIHKIASFEINHIPLLTFLFKTKKPIIISTGASTFEEIDFVVNHARSFQCQIALLQCTSCYPSEFDSLNLATIPNLRGKYDVPVGFSDHSTDPIIAPILAIGFGATIIEKHFTIDKTLPGPDHSFALNPKELSLMINSIRLADKAKGNGVKQILKDEEENRKFATRSIQAIKKISPGDSLHMGFNFDILRPGNQSRGEEPRFLDRIEGKKSTRSVNPGEGILYYE